MTNLFAFNQRMTPHNDFFADVAHATAASYDGIGLDELKMPADIDRRAHEAMISANLAATYVTPSVWPIMPGPLDQPDHPTSVAARTDAICVSIERFARFDPLGVVVGGGRSGDPANPVGTPEELAKPLAQIAGTAASHGMNVALEVLPLRRGSALPDIASATQLIADVGHTNIGLLIDVQHIWDEPDRDTTLTRHAQHVLYAQLNDVRQTPRTWADRLLPGDGLAQAAPIARALIAGGYDGWWELEVFSDDGTYGVTLDDSLWAQPHDELLTVGRERMLDTIGGHLEGISG